MRIVICGDCHIGSVYALGRTNKNGGNTRVDDYERTLNYIADYAISQKVDAFIQTGDLFDSRNPTPEHVNIVNRVLKKLSLANITSIIIMGNHDYRRTADGFTSAISSLTAAQDYPNVRIVLNPSVIKISNENNESVNLCLLPYRDRRFYFGKTTEENSVAYDNEVKTILNQCNDDCPKVAVGHNFYYDGSYNDFGGTEILTKVDTFNNCDLVVMGHYHQFKILKKKKPIAIYIGSMEKINFGDEKVDKYFLDFNTETQQVKVLKPPVKQLKDIVLDLSHVDFSSLQPKLEEEIKLLDIKDKIVRLRVLIRDTLISALNKNDIEKLLYQQNSYYVSRVLIEPVINRIVKDTAILENKDDYLMFESFIKDQEMEAEEREFILLEIKKVIEGNK